MNDEPFELTEKAAILRKAAELVWGIDAPWVEWALYLLYRRFAEINLAVGNIEKAADIYMILATQMDICYISQFDFYYYSHYLVFQHYRSILYLHFSITMIVK